MNTDPLAELKAIHLPQAISWWPLAPGWWLLLILVTTAIIVSLAFFWRWRKKNAFRRAALAELATLEQIPLSNEALLEALAELIRRTAISTSNAEAAQLRQLQGEQWQNYLQQGMPDASAHLLAIGRYQLHPAIDRQQLLNDCRQWIKGVKA